MNRLVLPVGFVLALLAIAVMLQSFQAAPQPASDIAVGPQIIQAYRQELTVPDATVTNEKGERAQIKDLSTEPFLLMFWDSQCNECQTGLRDLNDFLHLNPSFRAILVNFREEKAVATAKLQEIGLTAPNYFDDGSAFQTLTGTLPSSYYIVGGQIKYFFPGRIGKTELEALLTL